MTTTPPFAAPGAGSWQLETAHYPRPLTRFIAEPTRRAIRRAWSEATERYGLLFRTFEPALVNGFLYCRPVPVAGGRAARLPPRPIFQLLTRAHPALRRRIRQAARAVDQRLWRDDLRRWDEEVKPASIDAHLALQAIAPDDLAEAELEAHILRCRDNFERMLHLHHLFTLPCSLPLGDFLAHAGTWTGRDPGALLQLLSGSSPISLGVAAAELEALGAALRADAGAASALAAAPANASTLESLRDAPGAVGAATRAYVERVGHRSLGYDVGDHVALELPHVLVRAIRASIDAPERAASAEADLRERTAAVRDAVPAAERAAFDDLLAEARRVNRLRDERGIFTDCWAAGLARRAVLAAGRRLVERGVLDDPELAVDASADELVALLRGTAPDLEALRARARWRTTKTVADAPRWLGPQPTLPPPEWMPAASRRAARAFSAWLFTLIDEHEAAAPSPALVGLPASPGVCEGTARVALGRSGNDFGAIEEGDILVALATSPSFNVVLPLLGGVVTDRGGQLSHAAIVAREFGIPCVVGTKEATRLIRDGMRIRVDGDAGEVTIL